MTHHNREDVTKHWKSGSAWQTMTTHE